MTERLRLSDLGLHKHDAYQIAESEAWMLHRDDGGWVPLSVRHGNRRVRFAWWVKGRRTALAIRVAPWLESQR